MNAYFLKKAGFRPVPVRAIAVLLLMLLPCVPVLAEAPSEISFETYVQSTAFADGTWETDGTELIRMISPERDVTVSVCLEGEMIAAITVEYLIGAPTDSVRTAIESLGWISGQTLEAAFSQQPEIVTEDGEFSVCRIEGELREGISVFRSEDAKEMVWQPIHGGARIHNKPRCSGMDVSRMITETAAELTGWQNCGKCRKNK